MIKEGVKITSKVKIELLSFDGKLKDLRSAKNLIVTSGLSHIADQMSGQLEAVMSHIAIGTGATAAVKGDTTLQAEIARVAFTSKTQNTNTVTYIVDYVAGVGTGAIAEAGIFNAAIAGTMLARLTFSAINKAANDILRITWEHTYN